MGINIEGEKGIYDIVNGVKTFEESVKYIEKLNLYLLVAAAPVQDPSETLASEKMAEILEKFMKYGNIIDLEAIPVSLEEVIFDIYTRS